jgi:hypothetical protein
MSEELIDTVEHPYMRMELVSKIKKLSDRSYQKRYWCKQTAKHFFWDNLRMVREFIDDNCLFEAPYDQIGYSLRSEDELKILVPVFNLLEKVPNEIGRDRPDLDYLDSPLWEELIQASARAFKYIKDQGLDEKYVAWAEEPKLNS